METLFRLLPPPPHIVAIRMELDMIILYMYIIHRRREGKIKYEIT